uniref:MATA-HMG n=1 Tax=Anthurium amnicola TaxID=1678845 RepID=A0A1D1Z5J4_9ARAE
MGSAKSLRYEVLVYQTPSSPVFKEQQHQLPPSSLLPNDISSSNHSGTALFETKVQRFACDRENMQQYWIPEGFKPVLIPRAYLTNNSLVTTNNSRQPIGDVLHQLRSRINNNDNVNDNIEFRRRRRNANDIFTSCGITKKKRRNNNNVIINDVNNNRRTVLGQSSPSVNINPLIYKQRIAAIRNSAVKISSNSSLKDNNSNNIIPDMSSPSIIIGEMWKDEPNNIKEHYERLAISKKFAKALAFEQKFSSLNGKFSNNNNILRSTTTMNSRRHHVNPTTCPGSSCRYTVHNNATKGVDAVDCDNAVDISSSPDNFNDSSRNTTIKGDENSIDLGAY